MPNEEPAEPRLLRNVLRGQTDCPSPEQLERLIGEGAPASPDLVQHVESCASCRTELSLLRDFQSGAIRESEAEPVRMITERLRHQNFGIPQPGQPARTRTSPWTAFWRAGWLAPAALAAAAVLIFVAVGVQWRQQAPVLHTPSGSEQEVMRSNALVILAPTGDVQQVPAEFRWETTRGALKYQVRLMEVDHAVLWSGETMQEHIELPAQVRAQIVPHKTLLWEVTALDGSNHVVAKSDSIRFRLLQNVYTR